MFNYYIEVNGQKLSLPDFYQFIYGVEPAKKTIHKGISPATDVHTSEDGVTIQYELPGIAPENITVQLEKNELSVSGTKFSNPTKNSDKLERSERQFGKFTRVFTIGDEYDSEGLTTNYNLGVLEIFIPRKPAAKPKLFTVFTENKKLKE